MASVLDSDGRLYGAVLKWVDQIREGKAQRLAVGGRVPNRPDQIDQTVDRPDQTRPDRSIL